MSSADAVRAYAKLYGPRGAQLVGGLPDLAEKLHAQLKALYESPSEHSAESMARSLHEARVTVMQLADSLRRDWRA